MRLRTVFSGMALLAALLLTACDDEATISYGKLPSQAQGFIGTFFPDRYCARAEREKTDAGIEYKVVLSNGTQLEFDASGAWKDVDCQFSALPEGILPEAISGHLAEHYAQCVPYKVERQPGGGYEVSVSGFLELLYNVEGGFVREVREF